MKRRLQVAILTLILVLSLSPLMRIQKIEIKGIDSSHHPSISKLVEKKNWLWTSTKSLEQIILGHSHVFDVTVKKRFIFAIDILVEPRKAFASVHSGGFYVMIDENGRVLSLSEKSEAPYAIEGFRVQSAKVGFPLVASHDDLIEKAIQLVNLFQKNGKIKPDVHLINGNLIQKMGPKLWVDFGKGYDIARQFDDAIAIYSDFQEKKSTTGIINLSIPGQTVIQSWKE